MKNKFRKCSVTLLTIVALTLTIVMKIQHISAIDITLEPTLNPLGCSAKFGIWSVAFSSNSQLVLANWSLGQVRLWNVQNGEVLRTFHVEPAVDITTVAFSPDGKTIATADRHEAILWDIQTGERLHTLTREVQDDVATQITFSTGGERLLTSGYDGASLWDTQSGRNLHHFPGLQDSGIWQYAHISSDTKYVLTLSYERRSADLWDSDSGAKIREFGDIRTATFTPDSKALLTYGSKGFALWDIQTFGQVWNSDEDLAIKSWRFSPNGEYLIALEDDYVFALIVWNIKTGEKLYTFSPVKVEISNLYGFLPNDTQLVLPSIGFMTGESSSYLHTFDVETNQLVSNFDIGEAIPSAFQISPDGKYLLLGTSTGSLQLWEVETGAMAKQFC